MIVLNKSPCNDLHPPNQISIGKPQEPAQQTADTEGPLSSQTEDNLKDLLV